VCAIIDRNRHPSIRSQAFALVNGEVRVNHNGDATEPAGAHLTSSRVHGEPTSGALLSLQEMLVLEDDPAFMELVCPTTGVLAWPAIRIDLLRQLIGDRLYPTAPLVDLGHRTDLRRIAIGAVRATVHNLLHPPRRSDVLLVVTGAGLIVRDGRSFNRYSDHFVRCLGDRAWTMESLFGDAWPSPPRSTRRLGFLAGHRLALAVRARVATRRVHRTLAGELVDLAARRGRELLGWDLGEARRSAITAWAARRLAGYPIEARFVSRLLRKVKPRLVLLEEGCYGHMAVFNATARELGVTVGEFQHGMVTRGHDAYNVAPRLAASAAYRMTQPAAFLGYGAWWNRQFNAPVDSKVVIGNPHRTESLRSWQPERTRFTVLVLGDGVETEAYLGLCRRLAASAPPPLRVVFRPHPLEREQVRRGGSGSVPIDAAPDLYTSLAAAHAVVGEASTALFEAVGTVPRIFVWDTDKSRFYLGDHPFARFTDPAEVAGMLTSEDAGNLRGDVAGAMWADDWQGRFVRYINEQR
jgi:hypothetical protein